MRSWGVGGGILGRRGRWATAGSWDFPAYFATGIANSAPLPMLSGQRCITLFCLV